MKLNPSDIEQRARAVADNALRGNVPLGKIDEMEIDAQGEERDEIVVAAKDRIRALYGSEPAEADLANLELSLEQVWFHEFKGRFDALPKLHKGIQWTDVEKSLKADSESAAKLMALDAKGHAMNVFGEEKGEFVFASGWTDYNEVAEDHRNIMFDKATQDKRARDFPDGTCNGNATDIVTAMSVELAEKALHEQLRKAVGLNGWAWLKTDAATRKAGIASCGGSGGGVLTCGADSNYGGSGSFRASLRVKKA